MCELSTLTAEMVSRIKRAPVTVWATGPAVIGVDVEAIEAARKVSEANQAMMEKFAFGKLAHELALLCSDNVPSARLSFSYEEGVAKFCVLTLPAQQLTDDGAAPRFGGLCSDNTTKIEAHFFASTYANTLTFPVTFKVTQALSRKLFCDGDYAKFLHTAITLAS